MFKLSKMTLHAMITVVITTAVFTWVIARFYPVYAILALVLFLVYKYAIYLEDCRRKDEMPLDNITSIRRKEEDVD